LFRAPAGVKFLPIRRLADGSTLVWLEETIPTGKKTGKRRQMRLIEYRLTDPARPGFGERRRLLTSLLDPEPVSGPGAGRRLSRTVGNRDHY
jgi:hypothetical protein